MSTPIHLAYVIILITCVHALPFGDVGGASGAPSTRCSQSSDTKIDSDSEDSGNVLYIPVTTSGPG
jgi:hypothetical protein